MASDPRLTTFAIRHQIYLERLKTGKVRDFLSVMRESDATIKRLLTGAGVGKLNELSRTQLTNLINDLTLKQGEIFSRAIGGFLDGLPALAVYEAEHEARTLREVADKKTQQRVVIPSAKQLHDESMARPVQAFGKRVADVTKDWADSAIEQVNGAVRVAYEQGLTVPEVMKQVLGTAQLNYEDGRGAIARRTAATVVRTGIQQVASTARQVTYEENSDLVKGYEWVSTLDGKTSVKCRSLDGQKFKLEDGPLPPIHPNCRSTTTPDLGDEFKFLDKGATRSSQDGYTDANTTYYDFLKKQSPEFQDGVLGEMRGKLFREGGLTVDRFRELQLDRNFEPISLAEMRQLEPKAFERAGLSPGSLGIVQAPSNIASPSRPKTGTTTGKVWDAADALQKELGRIPTRQEVMARGRELGINDSTIGVQFGKWRAQSGPVLPPDTKPLPPPAVPFDPTLLTTKLQAQAPSLAEIEAATAESSRPAGDAQVRWEALKQKIEQGLPLEGPPSLLFERDRKFLADTHSKFSDGKGGMNYRGMKPSQYEEFRKASIRVRKKLGLAPGSMDYSKLMEVPLVDKSKRAIHSILADVAKAKKSLPLNVESLPDASMQSKAREAQAFLDSVTADHLKKGKLKAIADDAQARSQGYYSEQQGVVAFKRNADAKTYVHEITHHYEVNSGQVPRLKEWLTKRRKDEAYKPMDKVANADVLIFDDEWVKRGGRNYSSRVYQRYTEVVTTGAERLYEDPLDFYHKDPEHFEVTVRTLLDLW